MDETLAEFAAELERRRIRSESIIRELANLHRDYLNTLSLNQLLRQSAEIESRQIAHTIHLNPTREALIEMLVRFHGYDLHALPYETLVEMLPAFELPED